MSDTRVWAIQTFVVPALELWQTIWGKSLMIVFICALLVKGLSPAPPPAPVPANAAPSGAYASPYTSGQSLRQTQAPAAPQPVPTLKPVAKSDDYSKPTATAQPQTPERPFAAGTTVAPPKSSGVKPLDAYQKPGGGKGDTR